MFVNRCESGIIVGQIVGENKVTSLEKGNYSASALVNGTAVAIFHNKSGYQTGNLSLYVKIPR